MSKSLDDIAKNIKNTSNPAAIDSDLANASDLAKEKLAEPSQTSPNLTQQVIDRLDKMTPKGNTTKDVLGEAKTPFQPDVRVTTNKVGFSSQQTTDHLNPDVQITPPPSSQDQNAPRARSATRVDLANLTEADILDLPFIDAKSFDIPAMLQVKPKDPSIRFRWVNYKNYEGGNYAMFKAIGFSNAVAEDISGGFSEHLLKEDGTIKWFDVVLMKVNVIHLMGILKKNIIRSLEMVGRWQPNAIAQAKRTLANEVGADVLEAMRKAGHTVEFYAPSTGEMAAQDKEFAEGR